MSNVITRTEEVIASMMLENTGRHLLDSGGAYGRHWERNQGRDLESFRSAPRASIDLWGDFTIDLFHFLTDVLHYEEREDQRFKEFADSMPEDGWLTIIEEYLKFINAEEIYSDNSYNRDSMLSQVIQYTVYRTEDRDLMVLLQIHGGCDVRGGYTAPRAFSLPEDYALGFEQGSLSCSNGHYIEWSGGEWLNMERGSSDWDPWTAATEAREKDPDFKFIPCPDCGAELVADAWNSW